MSIGILSALCMLLQKKSKWITTGIIKSIKFRDNLYKRLKQTSPVTLEFWNIKHNLKVYNKILKRSIRQAKKEYYNYKFNSCKNDSATTWRAINEVINNTDNNALPDYILINDNKVSNRCSIANHFNTFFNNIGTEMAQ